MNKQIKTSFSTIGNNQPCYVIAEIGSNHNGNYDLACELIDKAVDAGVNAVKFQTFKASNHYSKFTEKISMYEESIYDLIEKLEIDRSWHQKLSKYCYDKGIDFLDSPTDFEAVDINHKLNVPLMKVASFDMVDLRLIDYISKTGTGVIFSTGMANLAEIQNAVNVCRGNGNDKIVVLQCTSLYPAPYHLSNLKSMQTIRQAFDVIVGYSDHTMGDQIVLASVALGAKVVEKHYTLNRDMEGPDHQFSMHPDELKSMVSRIRDVEIGLGDGIKNGPRLKEMELYQKARRSLHASRALKTGDIITNDDIVVKRPGAGIHPSDINTVVGRVVRNDIKQDMPILWSDI
jgi:sialic acid synthase SpsE